MVPRIREKTNIYMQLIRPFTLLPPAVGVMAGGLLAIGYYDELSLGSSSAAWLGFNFVPLIFAAILYGVLNGASNAYNQVSDLDIDRVNRPERPIPSGKISVKEALGFTFTVYSLGLVGAFIISFRFFLITALCLCITTLYSTHPVYLKKRFMISNVTIALCQGILFLLAGWVIYPFSYSLEPAFWFMGTILFIFLIGACGTKDFTEIEGDKKYGMKTLPVLYGNDRASRITRPFFIVPILLIPIGVISAILPIQTIFLTLLIVYGLYINFNFRKMIIPRRNGENSPAWRHYYFMLMALELGFSLVYLIQ
jgi:4-hydroxybenzoate polyprenyltransferase